MPVAIWAQEVSPTPWIILLRQNIPAEPCPLHASSLRLAWRNNSRCSEGAAKHCERSYSTSHTASTSNAQEIRRGRAAASRCWPWLKRSGRRWRGAARGFGVLGGLQQLFRNICGGPGARAFGPVLPGPGSGGRTLGLGPRRRTRPEQDLKQNYYCATLYRSAASGQHGSGNRGSVAVRSGRCPDPARAQAHGLPRVPNCRRYTPPQSSTSKIDIRASDHGFRACGHVRCIDVS